MPRKSVNTYPTFFGGPMFVSGFVMGDFGDFGDESGMWHSAKMRVSAEGNEGIIRHS